MTAGVAADEATFQAQLVELATMLGWHHLHIRRTRGRGGAWTTSTSVSGWPDLFFWHHRHGSFYAELKSTVGVVDEDQVKCLRSLAAAGLEVSVWWPADFPVAQRRLTTLPTMADLATTADRLEIVLAQADERHARAASR